jgi:hypothetical protein
MATINMEICSFRPGYPILINALALASPLKKRLLCVSRDAEVEKVTQRPAIVVGTLALLHLDDEAVAPVKRGLYAVRPIAIPE